MMGKLLPYINCIKLFVMKEGVAFPPRETFLMASTNGVAEVIVVDT
jgi:hypothetical protein